LDWWIFIIGGIASEQLAVDSIGPLQLTLGRLFEVPAWGWFQQLKGILFQS
jgi:hypothetical protein